MLNIWLKILVYHDFALANYSAFTFMAKLASFELKFCVFKDLNTTFYEKKRENTFGLCSESAMFAHVRNPTELHLTMNHISFALSKIQDPRSKIQDIDGGDDFVSRN